MKPNLAKQFAAIGRPRVVVVGDLMLDRYVRGGVDRVSPEAPIPVLRVEAEDCRPGGAGSVAVNLARLGARVALAGVLGSDADGRIVRDLLKGHGVDVQAAIADPSRPTTVKTRFLASVQQLLRVDREVTAPIAAEVAERLLARLEGKIRRADAVLVSDYNKGLLAPPLAKAIVRLCRQAGKPVVVDPPRGVDPAHYRGATAICPNRSEAALAAGLPDEADAIDKIGRRLLRRLGLGACIITRDREGMSLYRKGTRPLHVPARPSEVFDVTGAGDMVLAVLGLVIGSGGEMAQAVQLANVAGSIEVGRLGVVPLSRNEIIAELEMAPKLRTREELKGLVDELRATGKTVVFTNGCFDLLNPNHISLFKHCRKLGDVVIVATNSDESITRLKGPSRPVLPKGERAALLSAVDSIDYVTVFAEDTPRPLLRLLQPDILVKGGDYASKEEVVGWEIVEEYGGTIARAPMADYHSTSGIVDKITRKHKERSR